VSDRLVAPAKLTWSLRVVGIREDGYHLIDAEMVTLDLADELVITEAAESTLSVTGAFAGGVPTDASNLVVRALDAVGRTAFVEIEKRIPSGAGLGGGSADAAAILRWAGVTDLQVAAELGADVPFCVVCGRARVTGVGEIVDAQPPVDRVVTLVVPPLRVATVAVYRAWDDLGGPTGEWPNDLEPAALVTEPQLGWWRARIRELSGLTPVLAGSGSTWFVIGDHEEDLAPLTGDGAAVFVCRTLYEE
jgi:4-diphosphocytidyl-2-C-methyl-D-erythritol kinase